MNISQRITQVQQQLNKLTSSVDNATLNQQLTLLSHQLAQIAHDANPQDMSSVTASEVPELQHGCYIFSGQKGFYCPHCFDRDGTKAITTRINSKLRICSVCRASIK